MAYGTSNAPFGLRPWGSLTSATINDSVQTFNIQASADGLTTYGISIFSGDMVIVNTVAANVAGLATTANTLALYLPAYTQNAAGTANTFAQTTPVFGVFQRCTYTDPQNNFIQSDYWPAATQVLTGSKITAYVSVDPNILWDVQISTPVNATAGGIFSGGVVPGASAAPIFPGIGATAAKTSAIGSNYSIMGGGGVNFDTVTNPFGGKYANNPTSTMTPAADAAAVTVFGTNPYGGNTRTMQSGAYLCVSTYGHNATDTFTGAGTYNNLNDYDHTVSTLPLKVWGYSPANQIAPGATLQTTPFINLLVTLNNHEAKPGVAGPTFTTLA